MMVDSSLYRARRWYLGLLYCFAAIWGFSASFYPRGEAPVASAAVYCFALTLTLLVSTDARIDAKPIPTISAWLVIFFWPVAVPAVVIRARRWRGVGLVLLHAVLLTAAFAVGALLTWLAA